MQHDNMYRQDVQLKHAEFPEARAFHVRYSVAEKDAYRSQFQKRSRRAVPTSIADLFMANAMHHLIDVSDGSAFISVPVVDGELPLNAR